LYIREGIASQAAPIAGELSEAPGDSWLETSPACLVWFDTGRSFYLTVEALEALPDAAEFTLLAAFEDGRIYRVSRPD